MNLELLIDHPDAVPQVARWYIAAWGHEDPEETAEKIRLRIGAKLSRDRLPVHFVAVEEGQVIGTAQLKIREMDIFPEREHWLGTVLVAPEARGRGTDSELCEGVARAARSRGIETLFLQTVLLNGGLYAKLGWQPVEQVHYRGQDVLVMAREL